MRSDAAFLAPAGRASCGSEGATDFAILERIYDSFKAREEAGLFRSRKIPACTRCRKSTLVASASVTGRK